MKDVIIVKTLIPNDKKVLGPSSAGEKEREYNLIGCNKYQTYLIG